MHDFECKMKLCPGPGTLTSFVTANVLEATNRRSCWRKPGKTRIRAGRTAKSSLFKVNQGLNQTESDQIKPNQTKNLNCDYDDNLKTRPEMSHFLQLSAGNGFQ
jgi:hypothetical protein